MQLIQWRKLKISVTIFSNRILTQYWASKLKVRVLVYIRSKHFYFAIYNHQTTVKPPNNGHPWDEQ